MTLKETQQFFDAWLKNPAAEIKDLNLSSALQEYLLSISSAQLEIYQKLYLENIEGILKTAFPQVHKFLSNEKWDEIILSFLKHKNPSLHYRDIPLFFAEVVYKHIDDNPFLKELVRYECNRFYLPFFENTPLPPMVSNLEAELANLIPVLNPDFIVDTYHFNFDHLNHPAPLPQAQILALVRHPHTYNIEKLVLTEPENDLLTLIQNNPGHSLEGLGHLWEEKFSLAPNPEEIFLKSLKNLLSSSLVMGFKA